MQGQKTKFSQLKPKNIKKEISSNPRNSKVDLSWVETLKPNQGELLITANPELPWFTALPTNVIETSHTSLTKTEIDTFKGKVKKIYDTEVDLFHNLKKRKPSSDQKWINDVIQAGTASDKVAALALIVQESPIHNLSSLDGLIALAAKKEQRVSLLALDALKDLFIHSLLPDRRLRIFENQPLQTLERSISISIMFLFEDELISRVENFVGVIENGLRSTVEYYKKRCMDIAAEMLTNKPEQEARFLADLTDKLGDPSKAVCSKTIELLKKIIWVHPAMKGVIVREVRQFISRPGLGVRSVYLGIIFMNQIELNQQDHLVAASLVECYVSLFEKAVKQEELGSTLLSALLSGINRAFPVLVEKTTLTKYLDSLFRIVHTSAFATSTQALALISHIVVGNGLDSSNAYGSAGNSQKRKKQGMNKKGSTAAQELEAKQSDPKEAELVNRYYRALYAKLYSDEVTTRSRNTLFLNLLFRSIKYDPSHARALTFIKRLGIIALQCTAPIAAGILLLVSEVFKQRPGLVAMVTTVGLALPADIGAGALRKGVQLSSSKSGNRATTDGADDDGDDGNNVDDNVGASSAAHDLGAFDASKREPLYAASATPELWEASLLQMHFHPSVQAFAESLLKPPHAIAFDGDPTVEFSVSSFLNRFAYKNPKKASTEKMSRAVAQSEDPLNTTDFITTKAVDVAPDKRFFYKFFGEREKLRLSGKSRDRTKRKQQKDLDGLDMDGDGDGIDEDDEIDAFADKLAVDMMKNFRGSGAGPDVDDVDEDDDFLGDDFDDDLRDGDEDGNDDDHARGRRGDDDDDEEEEDGDGFDMDEDVDDENEVIDFDEYLKSKKGKVTKTDTKKKGKNLRRQDDDDDDGSDEGDFELMAFGDDDGKRMMIGGKGASKGSKMAARGKVDSGKGKKRKSGGGGDMDDFADASDYQEELNAIMSQFSQFGELRSQEGTEVDPQGGLGGSKKKRPNQESLGSTKGDKSASIAKPQQQGKGNRGFIKGSLAGKRKAK